jgi:hypothetical protein
VEADDGLGVGAFEDRAGLFGGGAVGRVEGGLPGKKGAAGVGDGLDLEGRAVAADWQRASTIS